MDVGKAIDEARQKEVQEKMRAENASIRAHFGITDSMLNTDCAGAVMAKEPEPMRYRYQHQLNVASGEVGRNARIISILNRHPEFEELLELLRLTSPHISF